MPATAVTCGGAFFGVNVACFDLTPAALAELAIVYVDGFHDAPDSPGVTSYL